MGARLALTNREFLFRHKSQRKPLAKGFDINRIYGATELSGYDLSRRVFSSQLAKLKDLFGCPLLAHELRNTHVTSAHGEAPARWANADRGTARLKRDEPQGDNGKERNQGNEKCSC